MKGEFSPALRHCSLEVAAGEIVGILGESGCGKSTLALSILGLLPKDARYGGSVCFKGEELLGSNNAQLRKLRGAKVALIHQEPGLALSPAMRMGGQIAEVLRAHGVGPRKELRLRTEEILSAVHFAEPRRIARAYAHELSGGELHRVAIAQALVCRPELVIADEPNRSLDVELQLELLELFREINRSLGTAFLFITHNPILLAGFADRVIVMRSGEIVEHGRTSEMFRGPAHEYTRTLLRYVPGPIAGAPVQFHRTSTELLTR